MSADSSEGLAARVLRLRRLVDAAGRVARDASRIEPLVRSTGLSPQGVLHALSRSLETDASDDDLMTLACQAVAAPRVHVILSANVFTAPLRALAVACAAAPVVTVRPSTRDPVFARALVHEAADPGLSLAEQARVEDVCEGEVHVYGRDETIAAVRSAARPGVTVRGHGAGLGVAVVTEAADVAEATRGIADDVVLFDQRGCLSPRVVVVLGSEERGDALAAELASKLGELERRVPRGGLDADEVRQARRYVDAMTFAGRLRRTDGGAVVALAPEGAPLHVPPTGRHVHLAVAPDIDHARALLAPIASLVVTVGCDDPGTARGLFPAVSAVRWTWLGRMQRPPLDGPVDLRRV